MQFPKEEGRVWVSSAGETTTLLATRPEPFHIRGIYTKHPCGKEPADSVFKGKIPWKNTLTEGKSVFSV